MTASAPLKQRRAARAAGASAAWPAGQPPLDPRSFEQALQALLDELRVRWYSKALQKQARNVLLRFFSHLRGKGIRDLRAAREEHVVAWARLLAESKSPQGKTYSLATQKSYLALVQLLFRFLLREGVVLEDPTLNLVLPSWKKLPRALLNQAQSRRLVSNPDPFTVRGKRDRAVLEILYGTAIRVGECERLDLRDVDLRRGQLFVRLGKGGRTASYRSWAALPLRSMSTSKTRAPSSSTTRASALSS